MFISWKLRIHVSAYGIIKMFEHDMNSD